MKPSFKDACQALQPEDFFVFRGHEIVYFEDNSGKGKPTKEAVEAKLKELQADYDSKQYHRDRAVAYDPIPEQLDQIYHDMDGWKAKVKAVKDKFPKPE